MDDISEWLDAGVCYSFGAREAENLLWNLSRKTLVRALVEISAHERPPVLDATRGRSL